jgi:hypothetical protein
MPPNGEKRTFARVETNFKAYVKRLTGPPRLPEPFDALNTEMDSGSRQDLDNSGLHEGMVAFLKSMDAKLSMIASFITQGRLRQEYRETVQVIELSGSGMGFLSTEEFTPGQYAEVVLLLSRYPLRVASAAGRIIDRSKDDNEDKWLMEFTHIREADLENIVQFVFREEREHIREKKWTD